MGLAEIGVFVAREVVSRNWSRDAKSPALSRIAGALDESRYGRECIAALADEWIDGEVRRSNRALIFWWDGWEPRVVEWDQPESLLDGSDLADRRPRELVEYDPLGVVEWVWVALG